MAGKKENISGTVDMEASVVEMLTTAALLQDIPASLHLLAASRKHGKNS